MALRHHVDVKTSSALPYMANPAKVYCVRSGRLYMAVVKPTVLNGFAQWSFGDIMEIIKIIIIIVVASKQFN